ILIKTGLLTKVQSEFQLLESFGLINGEYLFFKEHLERLKESAIYFDFHLPMLKIQNDLIKLSKKHKQGQWKVRLLVDKNGDHLIEIGKMKPSTNEVPIKLAYNPIDQNHLFLYHKTTHRAIYEENKIHNEDVFDTLLWNVKGEIT